MQNHFKEFKEIKEFKEYNELPRFLRFLRLITPPVYKKKSGEISPLSTLLVSSLTALATLPVASQQPAQLLAL